MAWEGSTRRHRLPPDWPELRELTRARAGGRCEHVDPITGERCTQPGTDCDHIVSGDDHSDQNLQWLCRGHHAPKSGREGAAARPSRKRPEEPHPGLL